MAKIFVNNEKFVVKQENVETKKETKELEVLVKRNTKLYKTLKSLKGTPFTCTYENLIMPFSVTDCMDDLLITFDWE